MHLSVDPPPVAKIEVWCGDQARAFTAALCSLNFVYILEVLMSHMETALSLPPEATILPSNDHLTPHTSWRWASYLPTADFNRTSHIMTVLSLDPLAIR